MAETAVLLVAESGATPERIDLLTTFLRNELADANDLHADPVPVNDLPEGSRGVSAAEVGAVLVTLGQSAGLRAVIDLARRWLRRSTTPGRSIKVSVGGDVLELTGASNETEQRLVDLFVERHS